ncbi:MAG: hypothetical protein A2173_02535 [Planctomycetes bacterium RBG_13_44_8b]|nr:MAG: hypothetical protein A2173_02535 [Planctomycetes bacterium RBG_13_44_8b]
MSAKHIPSDFGCSTAYKIVQKWGFTDCQSGGFSAVGSIANCANFAGMLQKIDIKTASAPSAKRRIWPTTDDKQA